MNWKTATIAVVSAAIGAGAGWLAASAFLSNTTAHQRNQSATVSDPSPGLSHSPLKSVAGSRAASASNSATCPDAVAAPQGFQHTTMADLATVLHRVRSRWDLRGLYQVLGGLETNQFPDAIRTILKTTEYVAKYASIQDLGIRWGRIDPQGALAFAQTLGSYERNQVIAAIVSGWAQMDSSAAIDWAKQLPNAQLKNQALGAVISAIGHEDPQAALALMNSLLPIGQARQSVVRPLFSEWASRSPTEAATAALQLSDSDRELAVWGVTYSWANQDPDAAFAWAANLPPGTMRNQALQSVLRTYAATNPQAAAALALQQPPGSLQNQAIAAVAYGWISSDTPAAIKWIQSLPDVARYQAIRYNVYQLMYEEPQTATELLASLPATQESAQIYQEIAGQWARNDLQATVAWAKKLPEGINKQNAYQSIGNTWADSDPARAVAFVLDLPAGGQRDDILANVASNWASKDPAAARAWATNLPDGSTHTRALSSVLSSWARTDPSAAAAYVDKLSAGSEQDNAMTTVVSEWSRANPQQAAAWVAHLPDGNTRDSAYRQVASSWAGTDPQGAAKWLDSFTEGKTRDTAVSGFVEQVAQADPATAAHWAETIQDDNLWRNAGQSVANQWLRVDEAAAKQWVAQAQLPEDFKKNFANQKP